MLNLNLFCLSCYETFKQHSDEQSKASCFICPVFFPNFLFDTMFFINAQLGSIIRTLNVKGVHLHEHFTDISGNMM